MFQPFMANWLTVNLKRTRGAGERVSPRAIQFHAYLIVFRVHDTNYGTEHWTFEVERTERPSVKAAV